MKRNLNNNINIIPGQTQALGNNIINKHSSDGWINKAQIAQHLGVCVRTINNWMVRGIIPHRRYPGNVVRFKLKQVEEALKVFDIGGNSL